VAALTELLGVGAGQLALFVGFGLTLGAAKMGLQGGPLVMMPFLAASLGAKATAGLVAPLLLVADIPAVIAYSRNCRWKTWRPLVAWSVVGIGLGAFVGSVVPERGFRIILGVTLVTLLVLMLILDLVRGRVRVSREAAAAVPAGVTAGFASMLGNAAAPVVSLYLLATGMEKLVFLGTTAVFYLTINLVKLPLHILWWQTITGSSLLLDLVAVPFILLGALIGKPLVRLLPEKAFRYFIMTIALAGSIRLLIG
jgi:uncharacterized membrane protein YfcA